MSIAEEEIVQMGDLAHCVAQDKTVVEWVHGQRGDWR
jgi:hypothetical protein